MLIAARLLCLFFVGTRTEIQLHIESSASSGCLLNFHCKKLHERREQPLFVHHVHVRPRPILLMLLRFTFTKCSWKLIKNNLVSQIKYTRRNAIHFQRIIMLWYCIMLRYRCNHKRIIKLCCCYHILKCAAIQEEGRCLTVQNLAIV